MLKLRLTKSPMIRPFIHKVTEIAVLLILFFAISEEVCDYVKVQFHLSCFMNESFSGFSNKFQLSQRLCERL